MVEINMRVIRICIQRYLAGMRIEMGGRCRDTVGCQLVVTAQAPDIEQTVLPDGAGVIAGICYLQSSGGKLGGGNGFVPYPRVPLLISSGGKEIPSALPSLLIDSHSK